MNNTTLRFMDKIIKYSPEYFRFRNTRNYIFVPISIYHDDLNKNSNKAFCDICIQCDFIAKGRIYKKYY